MANIALKDLQFPGLNNVYKIPEVDNTLTISGAAADAKKTGDELSDLKQDLSIADTKTDELYDSIALLSGVWKNGTILQDGTINTAYTYRISCEKIKYANPVNLTIAENFRIAFRYFDDEGTQTSATAWFTGTATINANQFVMATIARVTDDTSETADILEFLKKVIYEPQIAHRLSVVEGKVDYAVNAKEVPFSTIPLLTNSKLGGLSIDSISVNTNNLITATAVSNANGNPYVVASGTFGDFVTGKSYIAIWTGYAFDNCALIASNQQSWQNFPSKTVVVDGTTYHYAIITVPQSVLLSRLYFRLIPAGETKTFSLLTVQECDSNISDELIKVTLAQTVYNIPESFAKINNEIEAIKYADYSFIAYGDSLTDGTGSSGFGYRYVDVLQEELGAKNKQAFGYGGSGSRAIAFTAGAISAFIPPSVRNFALKYADLSTNVSIALNQLNGKTVIIGGNEYVIGQTDVDAYSLPNEYIPTAIYTPVIVKNSRYTADFYIIWMGTNDGGLQFDIIDAVISKLEHKKYIVMGLTRLGTDTTTADEEKAMKLYGSHFFNTRVQVINNAFSVLNKTPTAEDTTAMADGLMPPGLLYDDVHFNDDGYEAIGKLLSLHIKSLGYSYQKA